MLFLVATPIGNLQDISERAREVLQQADIIACEDTRTSGQLFQLLGIKTKKLIPYHEHNADEARPKIIKALKAGLQVALVSDAGTPLISDPGYRLVRECREQGLDVTTLPGANAVLSALQLSGLPSDAFFFAGFLSTQQGKRQKALASYKSIPGTLIFYETGNRLLETLADIDFVLGNREMALVREITKKFEETKTGTVQDLLAFYTQNGAPKGELVLVVDRGAPEEIAQEDVVKMIKETLQTHSVRDTVALVVEATGMSKKIIYKMVLDCQNEK